LNVNGVEAQHVAEPVAGEVTSAMKVVDHAAADAELVGHLGGVEHGHRMK
jgi:hypothetical protein